MELPKPQFSIFVHRKCLENVPQVAFRTNKNLDRKISSTRLPTQDLTPPREFTRSKAYGRHSLKFRRGNSRFQPYTEKNDEYVTETRNLKPNFECEFCEAKFFHKSAFSTHMLLHSNSPDGAKVEKSTSKSVKLLRRFRGRKNVKK